MAEPIDLDEDGELHELEEATGEREVPGGVEVELEEDDAAPAVVTDENHFENIADQLDQAKLNTFATELLELIEQDKQSREKRDKQYEEGLRRTGLGDDAPGGAQFNGATKVVHPMLTEACVDFASRAMKETFPAKGPAKSFIPGKPTREKVEKAERKAKHLNWQLTVQMKEFRTELEQLYTQVPLGGVQYMKLGWSAREARPTSLFVPVDEVYLPYAASSYYTAERRTHAQDITEQEYRRRVESGMYRDIDLAPAPAEPEQTAAQEANDKIEGRTVDAYNNDGLRRFYEVDLSADLEEDGREDPYIVTIDATTKAVAAVYRNWLPKDERREGLVWMIEFPFVPWRGAYPIGLTHMIGGLSGAATGALRALLDAAHINNFPGALKLKGGSKGGQSTSINPTQITEIEGSLVQDDIRKNVMSLPFNPPSVVLFQLLGFIVEAGRGVVRTTFEKLADGRGDMPVGTTLALIEQGMTVFSAIHGRLHNAMQRTLEVLHRINYMYQDNEELLDEAGELIAKRSDYAGPLDVVPVSDPNIFSETQRFAQVQAVVQRSDAHPELYDQRAVEKLLLERLKIPDGEHLLKPAPEPKDTNAVIENVAASAGRPVTAFPEQDHLAHLQTHLDFIASPVLGSSQLLAPSALPVLLNHLKEHVAFWYARSVYETVRGAAETDPEQLMGSEDADTNRELDQLFAAASTRVVEAAAQVFAKVPPVVAQAIKLAQSLAPPQPVDPTVAAAKAAEAETQRKAAEAGQKLQLEQAKDQGRQQTDAQKLAAQQQEGAADRAAELAREELRQSSEAERSALETAARLEMNTDDNETAMQLAAAEIESGERVAVSTGTGINPNP